MARREMTTEELTLKWECVREIENMMGRRTFYGILKQSDRMFDENWSKSPDICLGFNNGYYKGRKAVEDYYRATTELTKLKTELVIKANPQLTGKSVEELFGIGSLVVNNLTTPIIEIAEDFNSAKGLWYYILGDTDYTASGPATFHIWGWIGVDFVNEDDENGNAVWKILNMIITEDLNHRAGMSWADPQPVKPALPEYAAIGEFDFPQPNVPMNVYEQWHKKRPIKPFPAVPQPFDTFSSTFSYGI